MREEISMSDESKTHSLYSEHPWKTRDPDLEEPDPDKRDRKGLLLSDQIHRFCAPGVNLLIAENYSETNLRPAAYTLRIGDKYVDSHGRERALTDAKPSFEMPPNSIAFVSTHEKLNLPYYIAARFNLRVEWVYKGILLGTGPQVEPGFRGNLSCPLYNLTNRPLVITRREDFATIDFERTTRFVDKSPSEIAKDIKQVGKLEKYEDGDRRLLLFKQDWMLPLAKYPGGIVSSLHELSREVKTWRAIGIGIAVSFLALTLTLLGLLNSLLRDTVTNSKDLIELRERLSNAQQQLRSVQETQQQMKQPENSSEQAPRSPGKR
jgi:deoxycytidine triphosphate deaminase